MKATLHITQVRFLHFRDVESGQGTEDSLLGSHAPGDQARCRGPVFCLLKWLRLVNDKDTFSLKPNRRDNVK